LKYLDETNTTLTEYLTRLNTICSPALCSGRGDYDCSAPEDCNKPEGCDKLSCDNGDLFYTCKADPNGDYESMDVECRDEDGETYTDSIDVEKADCVCHPDKNFVKNIRSKLKYVNNALENAINELDSIESRINRTLYADEKLTDFRSQADSISETEESGFDVISSVDYNQVGYKQVLNTWCNYYQAEKSVKDDGICADYAESFGLYGAQITAAAVASYLTGGALSGTMKYAAEFFPQYMTTKPTTLYQRPS